MKILMGSYEHPSRVFYSQEIGRFWEEIGFKWFPISGSILTSTHWVEVNVLPTEVGDILWSTYDAKDRDGSPDGARVVFWFPSTLTGIYIRAELMKEFASSKFVIEMMNLLAATPAVKSGRRSPVEGLIELQEFLLGF